uniref:Uncharacterized protein n=1 Tax=Opuntia streptacantha TaxID=393608 RepID=A0A7C9DHJ0_OPUST
MWAPTLGRAVPLRTAQPVVCGQFPSSQSPMMGRTNVVSLMISGSLVNMLAHLCLTMKVKNRAEKPIMKLKNRPVVAARLARFGRAAPSSLPTRVERLMLREEGKM